jgi:hypothetical protein
MVNGEWSIVNRVGMAKIIHHSPLPIHKKAEPGTNVQVCDPDFIGTGATIAE